MSISILTVHRKIGKGLQYSSILFNGFLHYVSPTMSLIKIQQDDLIIFFCIPYTGQHGLQICTHNFTDYFHPLTHIHLFALSSVLRADFSHLRAEFLLQIACCVYAVYEYQCCMWRIVCWSKTPTYTHANLRTYRSFVQNWK